MDLRKKSYFSADTSCDFNKIRLLFLLPMNTLFAFEKLPSKQIHAQSQ